MVAGYQIGLEVSDHVSNRFFRIISVNLFFVICSLGVIYYINLIDENVNGFWGVSKLALSLVSIFIGLSYLIGFGKITK